MDRIYSRRIRTISFFLTAAFFVGCLPWREVAADANTHGEYNAYPFEITYAQNSTWGNSTQGQFEVTNISDYDVTSWSLEIDYYDDITLSNITGDIYSGRDFLYQGSELYMAGYARTAGTVQLADWITDMTGAEEHIDPLITPDWTEAEQ